MKILLACDANRADSLDDADVTTAYVDEPMVAVAIEVGWRNFV